MSAKTAFLLVMLIGASGKVRAQPDIGPALGRLVDVGGRKLHMICTGTGLPTVVIEAGASAFAIDFSLVQPGIARTNRVCSYDRAGSGWSDSRNAVETPAAVVADLHKALEVAGEKPPFILVGASFGGIYVRLYQLDYPRDVAGLVLIDPASEDRLFTMYQKIPVAIASLSADELRSTMTGSGSVRIPRRDPQTGAPFDKLPPDLYQLRIKLDQRLIAAGPETVLADTIRISAEGQRAALARLLQNRTSQAHPLGDLPLVVLTRSEDQTPGIIKNHIGLAQLSTNSRHSTVPNSGHEIHLFAPDAVIQAIQDVSTAYRQKAPLPARP
ncbi:MAG TPA: alpha/beta hydrolase [Gemmatimonadaceae bacterium]